MIYLIYGRSLLRKYFARASCEQAPLGLCAKCELPQMLGICLVTFSNEAAKRKGVALLLLFFLVTRGRIELPLPP